MFVGFEPLLDGVERLFVYNGRINSGRRRLHINTVANRELVTEGAPDEGAADGQGANTTFAFDHEIAALPV